MCILYSIYTVELRYYWDWDWGCGTAFLVILAVFGCVLTDLCLCKIHTRFLLTSSRLCLNLIQFESSSTFVRYSCSIDTLYFLQICNISLISGRRKMFVASQCKRKCVTVSLSALQSGHISSFLRPAVYDVAKGYLCTSNLALITAFLTSLVLYRFHHTGCNVPDVHCSMSKKDNVDILCASLCSFLSQNLFSF